MAGAGNWSVGLVRNGDGGIVGVWPYQRSKRWGLVPIAHPPLMSQVGPWLDYPAEQKTVGRHDFEWRWLPRLAAELPKGLFFIEAKMPYSMRNWMPLEQLGWCQTTRYSYVHPAEWDRMQRWRALAGRQRTTVRKAEGLLQVVETDSVEAIHPLLQASFRERATRLPLSLPRLRAVFFYLHSTGQGKAYLVRDERGKIHAGGILGWDRVSVYNLIQGSDPALRHSGAAALALWEATAVAADRGLAFDFEGSRVRGVEEFFRGFGGELWGYGELRKRAF